ncbi:hypothetical protein ACHQM5_023819 [Ranunculus cassubicifolius]
MDPRPYLLIATIQIIYVGLFLLSKAALNQGMNSFIFVFYRQAFATIFLVPLAIIFERKRAPPLSFVTFCKIFMFALFGMTISFNISGIALVYTTPSLAAATATANTLPAITFFLAVLLRMETVKFRSLSGVLKIFGVIVCLAGAATLALYKGPHLKPLIHHQIFGHPSSPSQLVISSSRTWVKGCFLMLASNVLWGLWLVLQGIMVTGVTFFLLAWCIEKKGPVFVAMSTPLSLILTTLCSVVFLGEAISCGSVLGGVLLVGGLYSVLSGKSLELKEEKFTTEEVKNNDNSDDHLGCDAEKGVVMI